VSTPVDAARPTIFFLHALGMSAREFDGVAARLDDVADVVALDLPGFGEASAASGVSVDDMAALVVRKVRRHAPARWLLVGHSMGGKIASVVASRALAGEHGLFGLSGVVLLAASPPSPEPMSDDDRAEKRAMADGGALDVASARSFVDANVGAPLDPATDAIAVGDVERASAEAWTAWFDRGSREDWSEAVGVLDVPALILAGGSDGDLGESAQRELNGRVYPRAQLRVLEGAGPSSAPPRSPTRSAPSGATRRAPGPSCPSTSSAPSPPHGSARRRGRCTRGACSRTTRATSRSCSTRRSCRRCAR
jgi:pimeloyl-ACP methyl ester carboxylesterase